MASTRFVQETTPGGGLELLLRIDPGYVGMLSGKPIKRWTWFLPIVSGAAVGFLLASGPAAYWPLVRAKLRSAGWEAPSPRSDEEAADGDHEAPPAAAGAASPEQRAETIKPAPEDEAVERTPEDAQHHDAHPRAARPATPAPSLDEDDRSTLREHAGRIIQQKRLDIVKSWLSRLVVQMDDMSGLESLPSKSAISTSLELIEGVGASLEDEQVAAEFEPGGHFYEEAANFGRSQTAEASDLARLSETLAELEEAIWATVTPRLRRQDREVLDLSRAVGDSLRRITAAASEAHDKQSRSDLDRLAYSDSLTGLHNRRFMMEELERQIQVYKRYHRPFALLLIDLDGLKAVNDRFGHLVGDCALRFVAGLMRKNMRDVDVLCRLGGDEFAVIMPETERQAAVTAGRRLASSVRSTAFRFDSSDLNLTISLGASSCPEDGVQARVLLEAADAELYRDKGGRGSDQRK